MALPQGPHNRHDCRLLANHLIGAPLVIDMDHHDHEAYLRPALVRIGAIVDIAAELEKLGITGLQIEYHPGDPIDWSNGRVS